MVWEGGGHDVFFASLENQLLNFFFISFLISCNNDPFLNILEA